MKETGRLYIVPTPIGNLEDITLRALNVLKSADIILAEDTRTSGKLLKHYSIETRMRAHHQHNEHKILQDLVDLLLSGLSLALITDAGTPAISDPGFLLVRESIKHDIPVETLPGATAFVPALVNSGLPCDKFHFEGFLPQKKGRLGRIKTLASLDTTLVFYESPYRLVKCLEQFVEHFGADRPAAVSRELSKIHEENVRGTLSELLLHFKAHPAKGEIVIIIGK
jgi:16S rRNA (cytidine1402-2'-O)-methyltransferase